jgi:hypothetical protein
MSITGQLSPSSGAVTGSLRASGAAAVGGVIVIVAASLLGRPVVGASGTWCMASTPKLTAAMSSHRHQGVRTWVATSSTVAPRPVVQGAAQWGPVGGRSRDYRPARARH